MKPIYFASVCIVLLFAGGNARASHIVGGEMSYVYMGDSTSGSIVYNKYRVSLSIYEDCLNGQPEAIAEDNPAYLGVFDAGTGATYTIDTNVYFTSSVTVPVNFSTACGSYPKIMPTCLLKKTFIANYYLLPNSAGYTMAYERCCRNASIVNVMDPANYGATYYCRIPASPVMNSSAVFKNYPPQIVCLNLPMDYDNSATDFDGDSLSYGFCAPLNGGNNTSIKPRPYNPYNNDTVTYVAGFSSQNPISARSAITINPVTGLMTGVPNEVGRYLVNVYCAEWRGGVVIDTVKREFQFVVAVCSGSSYLSHNTKDTIIVAGDSINFQVSGGDAYFWSPGTYLSNATVSDPVGHFPVPGDFQYTVFSINDSGCNDLETINVQVWESSGFIVPNAFTPNGDSKNDILRPLPVLGGQLISFKIFDRKGIMVYNGGPIGGWDGTYNGVRQDMGVYYWYLQFIDANGLERRERGDVMLVR